MMNLDDVSNVERKPDSPWKRKLFVLVDENIEKKIRNFNNRIFKKKWKNFCSPLAAAVI